MARVRFQIIFAFCSFACECMATVSVIVFHIRRVNVEHSQHPQIRMGQFKLQDILG